ncbi:MAG: hypothetical protein ACRCY4_03820 [Brevinema sp.]
MNEKQLDSILKAVRSDEVSHASVDRKLQRLISLEQRKDKFSLFHIKPLSAVAFGILLVIGLVSTVSIVSDAQVVAQNNLQEQAEMMEARNDMLSNTEHIYTVLFNDR